MVFGLTPSCTDRALLEAIAARFPGTVDNGALNRKKLGSIVFSDETALLDLNRITHSAVKQEVLRRLENKPELAAIDAIGLFEGGLSELCDITVAVTAPEEARVARLTARDHISEAYALSRIRAQRTEEEFASLCDIVLRNDTTENAFREKCLAFLWHTDIIKP